MTRITDIAALEALYDAPSGLSVTKVVGQVTPLYARWIAAARFVVLSTVGPEGTDASPRGDDGPVVALAEDGTLLLPDWRGNNRLDSLRNIVRDGRVSLMFLVPGAANVVRVNGTAILSVDPDLTGRFDKAGKRPKCVIVITVAEVYFQCAKAILRSGLWSGADAPPDLPTAGAFLQERQADFDADSYDDGYVAYAKPRLW